MDTPDIRAGNKKVVMKNGNFFLNSYHDKEAKLSNWVIIWEKDKKFLEAVVDEIKQTGKRMGIKVDTPQSIKMPDGKRTVTHLKDASQKAMKMKPRLILYILDNFTAKKGYSLIKKNCSAKKGILTQVIKLDWRKIKKRGVFDKLTCHLATKLDFTPWKVEKPKTKSSTLLVGADVYHKRGNESVAAVIGTLDPEYTKYCSFHSVQPKRGQEIMDNISKHVLQCVKEYQKVNNDIPKTLIFYRDGVGQGQLDLIKQKEIAQITKGLSDAYGAKRPKLIFIVVTKRLNDRFF